MKLFETLNRIDRVDQLIRLKATGTPKRLATRLKISESSLYELLKIMKEMGAPIYYCSNRESYCYKEHVTFIYGFSSHKKNTTPEFLE